MLTTPYRLVLDVAGATLTANLALYDGIERAGIRNIRYAQFAPGVVRVVIDLSERKQYAVESSEAGIRIKFGAERSFLAWSSLSPATMAPPVAGVVRTSSTGRAPEVVLRGSDVPAQQLRVQHQDSVRQARERTKADSLARLAEHRRTDSLAKVKSDSIRADSLALAKETEVLRETFSYSGASRDPFQSVIAAGTSGPDVGDLQLVAIYADVRSARNSVAVLRERQGARRWRVRIGDRIGTATVSLITLRDVTFNIQDFGFERQETLSLRKLSEDTP